MVVKWKSSHCQTGIIYIYCYTYIKITTVYIYILLNLNIAICIIYVNIYMILEGGNPAGLLRLRSMVRF